MLFRSRDRSALAKDIEANQKQIATLNDQAAPIRAEVRKVEAEVGPIKYIAKLIYDDNPDANILEKAVTWVIMIIVAVFDPLALVLILAGQQQIRWSQGEEPNPNSENDTISEWFDRAKKRARFWDKQKEEEPKEEVSTYTSTVEDLEPVVDEIVVPWEYFEEPEVDITQMGIDEYSKTPDPYVADVGEKPTAEEIKEDPLAHIVVPEIPDDDPLHKLAKTMWMSGNPTVDEREYHAQHQAGEIDRLPWHDLEHLNNLPISDGERKQLIDRFVNQPTPPKFYEINPLGLQPDNVPTGITGDVTGFGTSFPNKPNKGDMFLRVDQQIGRAHV